MLFDKEDEAIERMERDSDVKMQVFLAESQIVAAERRLERESKLAVIEINKKLDVLINKENKMTEEEMLNHDRYLRAKLGVLQPEEYAIDKLNRDMNVLSDHVNNLVGEINKIKKQIESFKKVGNAAIDKLNELIGAFNEENK